MTPRGLAFDRLGNLYIADSEGHRVRKVTPQGIITTIAGTGERWSSGDGGPAINADVAYPQAVVADSAGNVYICEGWHPFSSSIRKIDPAGIITSFAGGAYGYGGDGGPAKQARINYPLGMALDSSGNLYLADTYNHRVRRITTAGVITTVAGNGVAAFAGDGGPATAASLNAPSALAFDNQGNMYLADAGNQRIRKVHASGVISTVAGNGAASYSGDGGSPLAASLKNPAGVAVDASGNLYIADTDNNRIRAIPARPATYTANPSRLAFTATAGASLPASQQLSLVSSVVGLGWEMSAVLTSSGGSWLSVSASSGMMPSLVTVSADASKLAPGTYQGTVEISAPAASPSVTAIPVTFTVTSAQPAGLLVLPASLDFRMQAGGTTPPPQSLRIENLSLIHISEPTRPY